MDSQKNDTVAPKPGSSLPKGAELDESLFLSRLTHFPAANVHGFNIKIVNTPGALLKLVEAIAREDMNIISVEGTTTPESDYGTMYVVVDFTATDKGPADLLSKIKNVPSIRSVIHVEPLVLGFLADTSHFPLRLSAGQSRCFIVSELFWQSFLSSGYDKMGIEPTKLFFFQAGVHLGRTSVQAVKGSLHLDGEDIIRVLLHQGKSLGWWDGKGEANLTRDQLDLKLWYNWEGEYAKKWKVGCHAVRGFWEGVVSEIQQKRSQITEISCISKGSEHCEFRLMS